MAVRTERDRAWMEYSGYMYCGEAPSEEHHWIPRAAGGDKKKMVCQYCGTGYNPVRHTPPVT